jgi:hypothetical protein
VVLSLIVMAVVLQNAALGAFKADVPLMPVLSSLDAPEVWMLCEPSIGFPEYVCALKTASEKPALSCDKYGIEK